MLTDSARRWSRGLVAPIVRILARLGLTPNSLTVAGALAHVAVGWLLAVGQLRVAGVALACAAAIDGLDGALARATNKATRFGAFLDSTFDRVSEIVVFAGILWFFENRPHAAECRLCQLDGLLVLAALTGSLMVSYTRARSEGLACGTKAGILGRLERMLVLVAALVTGRLELGLGIIAIGAWATALQRVLDVERRCRALDA